VTRPVRPNELAQREIAHELRWYEEERVGLGDRLWDDIQAVSQLISTYPQVGEIVRRARTRGTVRRFALRHFPFFIIYREQPEFIELVALAPMRRNPSYWSSRIS
jgi:toxin ParE1/3/4